MNVSLEEAKTLSLDILKKRIDDEEDLLSLLNKIYVLRCELKAHEDAERISNCKGKWKKDESEKIQL